MQDLSNVLRFITMNAIQKAKSGHPGMPLGMADVATVLFFKHMKFYPNQPKWWNRDRLILSAGHGSMLLYSLLWLSGYEDITIEDIKNFRQFNAKTAGHPEYGLLDGIETTSGPLGQGFANAVGLAISERIINAKFNGINDNYTYVMLGDGCLMEGISHEAASLAGHLKLNKLIALFDDNNISIDGKISLTSSDDTTQRFLSYKWNVIKINGHDENEIDNALEQAKKSDKPTLISCKTLIAKYLGSHEGSNSGHSWPIDEESLKLFYKNIGYEDIEPFTVPQDLMDKWRSLKTKHKSSYEEWSNKLQSMSENDPILKSLLSGNTKISEIISNLKSSFYDNKTKEATRNSSGKIIDELYKIMPNIIGGSADLTGSNKTKSSSMKPLSPDNYDANYIYYGVREHAMSACMNGIALYGNLIPYGGTFFVFSDYCRPSIRLSALMKQKVIYVMTHDSIGVGEDGPTHQPIEHLSSIRAIPDIYMFRPADSIETTECWELALTLDKPSVLALTRQSVPTIIRENIDISKNSSELGCYTIKEASNIESIDFTFFASGSELSLAIEAATILTKEENLSIRVISTVCWELFFDQSKEYKIELLCNSSKKVAIEAGIKMGWEKFIGPHGIFIGMEGFGSSAPAENLFEHYGITTKSIVEKIKSVISKDK